MKLLYCRKCGDVFNLQEHLKSCSCGETTGRYVDKENAEYSGDRVIPFAIDNHSFRSRAFNDETRNEIYDQWYGEGKVWCWILQEGSPNFETITKVETQKATPKVTPLKKCG